MNSLENNIIRFGAVGDLLMSTRPGSESSGRGLESLSTGIRDLLKSCDLVLANLECTLPGSETVPTEPRVVSTEKQIASLRGSGIDVVTLGNNHMFDCLDEGFERLISMLKDLGIGWFGAGRDLTEAQHPAVVIMKGIRVAFLGCVDNSSGPFRFADTMSGGVAPLNPEDLCRRIEALRKDVEHVIVSPHWGRERFKIPSPEQIAQARSFVEAGASMVLGHHPHVLQGMEIYRGAAIIYSLGNFLANNVYWQNGDILTWSRFERTSCILVADLSADGVLNVKQIPLFDDGKMVQIETSDWGVRCLKKVNRLLSRGITNNRYKREKFNIEVFKPVISHLRWSELRKIRPNHFRKAWALIHK